MRNILLVIKHEIITTLQKLSFWIMTFIFPGLVLGLSVGMQLIGTQAIEAAEEAASDVEQAATGVPIGYVDEADLIDSLPAWVPPGFLESYPNVEAAKAAIEAGDIHQYYLIPKDFIQTGNYLMVDRDFQPFRSSGNAEIFEEVLYDVLTEKDPYGPILSDPTQNINGYPQAPAGPDTDDPMTFVVPMATMFIFFFIITTSGGFLLNSVTREKENRTAETLLVSLEPKQLMVGKVVGLGFVALLQMTVWMGGMLYALNHATEIFGSLQAFSLPKGFLLWALAFFVLGYFVYASILGAIGVLAPNAREGGQFTFIAILPLMIPLWFNYSFTETPDGPLSIFLSLFPLTAPTSMMTRLTTGNVPIWQILISLIGLAITAYFFVSLSARLFRADTLLSSESISLKRFRKEIRKR